MHIQLLDVVKKCPIDDVVFSWEGNEICFSFHLQIVEMLVIPLLENQIQQNTTTLSCFFSSMMKGPFKGFFCHLDYSFTTLTQIQWFSESNIVLLSLIC